MAYIFQADVATADLWSAAAHNILLHNIQAGVPDIFTAAGDMAYATAADVAARIPIGGSAAFPAVLRNAAAASPGWSNIGINNVIRKTTQTQVVNNSTVLVNDDALFFNIAVNEIWEVTLELAFTIVSGASGIKFAFTGPAAPTSVRYSGYTELGQSLGKAVALGTVISVSSSTPAQAHIAFLIANGANAGTIQLQWAQVAAAVGNTFIETNSYMVAKRLA